MYFNRHADMEINNSSYLVQAFYTVFLKQVLIFLLLMNESISVPRLLLLQRDTGIARRVLHWSAFLNHFWFRAFLHHKHIV